MLRKKNIINFTLLGILVLAFIVTGCGKGKDKIELPEEEMSQFEFEERATCDVKQGFTEGSAGATKKFYVYADRGYFKNHFIPSGWMGDYGDLRINQGWNKGACSRRTCIRIDYTAERKQGAGWAGIYWQEPANNWGNMPGGYDLTGATKLTFWAKGEKGGEIVTEFKMGGISGEFSDSTSVSIGPIVLTPEWQKYTIDLKDEDLTHVIGGFTFVISSMENPEGAVFYLDDITYE